MSRRQTSQPTPSKAQQRSAFDGSAKQLGAWAVVGISLTAAAAWFFFHEPQTGSASAASDHANTDGPSAATMAAPIDTRRNTVGPAVHNVSWPVWDEVGNASDGDAGVLDASAPQVFSAEVVIPVIPPPGAAPTRARDTGLQFSSEGDPAAATSADSKPDQKGHEPSARTPAPAPEHQAANAVIAPALPVAMHERTATEAPPPSRQAAPDRGIVFSDSPAPLPEKR